MYILTGFLNSLLSKTKISGFTASVAFEQSYGMIDGDSATCAELLVVISALSGIPISQDFAVTGSLNQFGEVQPVGGVNEKIEGFLKASESIRTKKPCHIIMPVQNQSQLMLHPQARRAVADGRLKIYPCTYFWQVFELATGKPFGTTSVLDKTFVPGSALDIISKRLTAVEKERDKDHDHAKKVLPEPSSSTTKKIPAKNPVKVKPKSRLAKGNGSKK
jgi:predicted ATP-dependent protease